MRKLLLAVCLGLSATGWAAVGQKRARLNEFSSAVELVNVNVSVLNRSDGFVTDLGPQDFVVLENGVPQKASLFAQDNLPISVALLLDVSDSMTPRMHAVRRSAARLIEKLRPEDSAEIIAFNEKPKVLQEFTSDHARLLDAVQSTQPGGTTALHNTLYLTLKELAASRRAEEIRRRAIVLLSDGEDTASMISDDQVLEAARAGDVGIYPILLGATDEDSPGREQARFLLDALARDSGGQAFFPGATSELNRLYTRISQELRSQYNIGYISTNPNRDGSWREILVMTPDRHGLVLRHRAGYYAAREAPLPKQAQKTTSYQASPPAGSR